MNRLKSETFFLVFCALVAAPALAQSEDRYDYCRERARDISGYYGPIPAEYEQKGGALKGAMKGAAAGATLAWISGGDRKDRKKAAKRAAALGALAGGIKKAKQDKKRRENQAKRRRYEVELNACMDERRK